MSTLDELLNSASAPSAFSRESKYGDSVTGIITDITVRQATDIETKEPLFFAKSGKPQENIVVTIKAEGVMPLDEHDDMTRTVWVKGWGLNLKAFQDAVEASGKPEVGDRFTATYVREQPSSRGGFPAKVYEYRITPAESVGAVSQADLSDARAQAQKLIGMGTFTDEQVAAATALPLDEVKAMGNVPF